MMVYLGARDGLSDPGFLPPTQRVNGFEVASTNNVADIITSPVPGNYKREMVTWRLPQFGYIKMWLNPQNVTITEGKDISTTRTKAGFIIQYAGEKLTEISITGVTGSAGMEGVNILRAIYRSEQFSFEAIATELDRNVITTEISQLVRGVVQQGANAFGSAASDTTFPGLISSAQDIGLNIIAQPFPTLASLAANVEMFFQGELHRGYFTSFTVTENAERAGHFDYDLKFTSYARQGTRRNFMPWHRQPYNPAGSDGGAEVNPLSFTDLDAQTEVPPPQTQLPNSSNSNRTDTTLLLTNRKTTTFSRGPLSNGSNLSSVNLEDSVG